MSALVEWGPERAGALAALVDAAAPAEELTADELLACCWEDPAPSVVLATGDGTGSLSAVVRGAVGFVRLVVVHPAAQRQGVGRRLVEGAHAWLLERGATEVHAGASAPFYLWPGVAVDDEAALALFTAAGYAPLAIAFNMRCATTYRAEPPEGVEVRRALDDDVAGAVLRLVGREWPWWEDEVRRGLDHGCCHAALELGAPLGGAAALGFACHSVNRAGWIGPMGTDPQRQRGGVGRALLGQLCRDLMIAEIDEAEIAWVGPAAFYEKAAGARVSRRFQQLRWHPPRAAQAARWSSRSSR